jgi:hypothetical protein
MHCSASSSFSSSLLLCYVILCLSIPSFASSLSSLPHSLITTTQRNYPRPRLNIDILHTHAHLNNCTVPHSLNLNRTITSQEQRLYFSITQHCKQVHVKSISCTTFLQVITIITQRKACAAHLPLSTRCYPCFYSLFSIGVLASTNTPRLL